MTPEKKKKNAFQDISCVEEGRIATKRANCLLSLSFKGRDCDMPVGVAATKRDAAVVKGVFLYASNGRA